MDWKDRFNRPMDINTPEYRLAEGLKALKRKVDRGEITEEKALEIMEPLMRARALMESAEIPSDTNLSVIGSKECLEEIIGEPLDENDPRVQTIDLSDEGGEIGSG